MVALDTIAIASITVVAPRAPRGSVIRASTRAVPRNTRPLTGPTACLQRRAQAGTALGRAAASTAVSVGLWGPAGGLPE